MVVEWSRKELEQIERILPPPLATSDLFEGMERPLDLARYVSQRGSIGLRSLVTSSVTIVGDLNGNGFVESSSFVNSVTLGMLRPEETREEGDAERTENHGGAEVGVVQARDSRESRTTAFVIGETGRDHRDDVEMVLNTPEDVRAVSRSADRLIAKENGVSFLCLLKRTS